MWKDDCTKKKWKDERKLDYDWIDTDYYDLWFQIIEKGKGYYRRIN